jgi:hypothetical protein
MDATNPAEQIRRMLDNLRDDVKLAQEKLDEAKVALRDSLAAFKPGNVGRPPGTKKTRTRKAKVVDTPVVAE